MTVAIAATSCMWPQYGHFSEVVPGAYSSRAPQDEQWNVSAPGRPAGGAGVAVAASSAGGPGCSDIGSAPGRRSGPSETISEGTGRGVGRGVGRESEGMWVGNPKGSGVGNRSGSVVRA